MNDELGVGIIIVLMISIAFIATIQMANWIMPNIHEINSVYNKHLLKVSSSEFVVYSAVRRVTR